jgi:hypothetical protein
MVGDNYGDINSLETSVLNDNRLDREDNQDDDEEQLHENYSITTNMNGPMEELMSLVAQTGLFSAQATKEDQVTAPPR